MKPDKGYRCSFCSNTIANNPVTGEPHHHLVSEDDGEYITIVFVCPDCWAMDAEVQAMSAEYAAWLDGQRGVKRC